MVVSVDVKFVIKSTNEHPYHLLLTIYSCSKANWNGLRGYLRDVHWLDIFKHDATYAAKEITEWVEIGIDCYIPPRKFQLQPHSSSCFSRCAAAIAHRNHYFHQYHRNTIPEIRNCFVTVRESSKMRGPIMLKQLAALLHLSLSDLVTSGRFATAFLTGGCLQYLLFIMVQRSWQHPLTRLTSAWNLSCNSRPPWRWFPTASRFSISYWTDT